MPRSRRAPGESLRVEIRPRPRSEDSPPRWPETSPRRRVDEHRQARSADRGQGCGESPTGAHRESSTPARPWPSPSLVGLAVLVVDDDESTLDYFAAALGLAGATVTTAATATDALRLLQGRRPDVVLSDIAMAGQDGYWLVREIRGLPDPQLAAVPVVATTAYGRLHSREHTLAAGFADHLAKPVEPERLCATIARAAGR